MAKDKGQNPYMDEVNEVIARGKTSEVEAGLLAILAENLPKGIFLNEAPSEMQDARHFAIRYLREHLPRAAAQQFLIGCFTGHGYKTLKLEAREAKDAFLHSMLMSAFWADTWEEARQQKRYPNPIPLEENLKFAEAVRGQLASGECKTLSTAARMIHSWNYRAAEPDIIAMVERVGKGLSTNHIAIHSMADMWSNSRGIWDRGDYREAVQEGCEFLAKSRVPETVDKLTVLLGDKSLDLGAREWVAHALGGIGDERAFPALADQFYTMLPSQDSMGGIMGHWNGTPGWAVMKAMAKTGKEKALPFFDVYADPVENDPNFSQEVLWEYGIHGGEREIRLLKAIHAKCDGNKEYSDFMHETMVMGAVEKIEKRTCLKGIEADPALLPTYERREGMTSDQAWEHLRTFMDMQVLRGLGVEEEAANAMGEHLFQFRHPLIPVRQRNGEFVYAFNFISQKVAQGAAAAPYETDITRVNGMAMVKVYDLGHPLARIKFDAERNALASGGIKFTGCSRGSVLERDNVGYILANHNPVVPE